MPQPSRRSLGQHRKSSQNTAPGRSRSRGRPTARAQNSSRNRPQTSANASTTDPQIILFNKPFNTLCQFTDAEGRDNLSHYIHLPGFYAAGRLDRDSEGLLVLTNDGQTQHRISHPRHKLPKTYLAQVEGDITDDAIRALQRGIELNDGRTLPANARRVAPPAWLWPRVPPIRERQSIPTSWIELILTEGRNRQVRRMTAATGFPTLRLVRTQVGLWTLGTLRSGEWRICGQND